VPLISHGDEYGRTQNGNNNVYCQNNELSWFDWNWDKTREQLFEYTRKMINIRKSQPVTHKRRFFKGRRIRGKDVRDIRWLNTEGTDMTDKQWNLSYIRCMGMLLNGELINEVNESGIPIKDDILLLIVNSFWDTIFFKLPNTELNQTWEVLTDTSISFQDGDKVNDKIEMPPRSLILLRNLK
jgi:glycogen operon protein